MSSKTSRASTPALGTAALAGLVLLLYGRHLAGGYLADDFLYLSWWREGWGELLRKVTVDSDPRMIRPLPALAWALSELPAGAALQHGLSLLAHALCGALVARLAARAAGPALGLALGALFVSFPLFTEPVIWLAAAPDLWAAAFALAALDVGFGSVGPGRIAAAAGLFALSLLCKESTLLLPLLPLCLAPREILRPRLHRLCLSLAAVAAGHLAFRLILFGGVGGYLDPEGRAEALQLDPLRFLRNLTLQLPYRLASPLKRAGDLAPLFASLSALLALAVALAARPWREPRRVLLALAAFVLALAPVAAFFSIDYDHENGRLLYFPIAILAAAAGAVLPPPGRWLRLALVVLILYWTPITIGNGRSWSEGALEVESTLAALKEIESGLLAGATLMVAGHDTWRGAYVWRNGLAFAARRAGLRDDVLWTLGTAALVPRPKVLGRRVFEIGPDATGRIRDWTDCQRVLRTEPRPLLGSRPLSDPALRKRLGRLETGGISLRPASWAPAVVIVPAEGRGDGVIAGSLSWRHRDVARFNVSDSRRFLIFPGQAETAVRLPAARPPLAELGLRIEAARLADLAEVRVVEMPEACLAAPGGDPNTAP